MRWLVWAFAGRTYYIVGNLMHWLKLPTILILLLNKLFKSMTYQNLLKNYLEYNCTEQYGEEHIYMILIEFLVKSLYIANMITLPTVWVSIKCLTY